MNRIASRVVLCATLVALGALAFAGPLNPPPGPVTSTYKTLFEVEPRTAISSLPFTISQSGSYYLTGNLAGAAGANGINVVADNVTIDLNGFTIDGANRTGLRGINCEGRLNVTIRNGAIVNWNREAINGTTSHQMHIDGITAENLGGLGIYSGYTSVVSRCTVRNASAGIIVADASTIAACTADGCQRGFEIGNGSSASDCAAASSVGDGFDLGLGVTIHNCSARGNGGDGFRTGASCTITNCTSSGNFGRGFVMDGAGQLLASTSSGNTGVGVDISVPNGTAIAAKVDGCTINFNGGHGLAHLVGGGSTFSNNTIARNAGAGIAVQDGNFILNNRIVDNGQPAAAAGIQVNGSVNTIQGNNLLNNGVVYSFAVGTANNNFFGNVCGSGNRFNSGANNIAPFVSANTAFAGGSLANTNNFVNIQY